MEFGVGNVQVHMRHGGELKEIAKEYYIHASEVDRTVAGDDLQLFVEFDYGEAIQHADFVDAEVSPASPLRAPPIIARRCSSLSVITVLNHNPSGAMQCDSGNVTGGRPSGRGEHELFAAPLGIEPRFNSFDQ